MCTTNTLVLNRHVRFRNQAYSKAIGTGIGKYFSWKNIEILNDVKGKPYIVHLTENEYSKYKYEISISHTEDYACAIVTCEEI